MSGLNDIQHPSSYAADDTESIKEKGLTKEACAETDGSSRLNALGGLINGSPSIPPVEWQAVWQHRPTHEVYFPGNNSHFLSNTSTTFDAPSLPFPQVQLLVNNTRTMSTTPTDLDGSVYGTSTYNTSTASPEAVENINDVGDASTPYTDLSSLSPSSVSTVQRSPWDDRYIHWDHPAANTPHGQQCQWQPPLAFDSTLPSQTNNSVYSDDTHHISSSSNQYANVGPNATYSSNYIPYGDRLAVPSFTQFQYPGLHASVLPVHCPPPFSVEQSCPGFLPTTGVTQSPYGCFVPQMYEQAQPSLPTSHLFPNPVSGAVNEPRTHRSLTQTTSLANGDHVNPQYIAEPGIYRQYDPKERSRPSRKRKGIEELAQQYHVGTSKFDNDQSLRDAFLCAARQHNYSYKEIKEKGEFKDVAESTLRGRYRSSMVPKDARARKRAWKPQHIELLVQAVVQQLRDAEDSDDFDLETAIMFNKKEPKRFTKALSWKYVAKHIARQSNSHVFGVATCKKKWEAVCGDKRLLKGTKFAKKAIKAWKTARGV